jgi:TonB family protein
MLSIIAALLFELSAGVTIPASLMSAVSPKPPMNAIAGTCVLADATVDVQGQVAGLSILQGLEPFNDSATRAIKQWKFTPATLNGQSVASRVGVLTVFRPAAIGNTSVGGPSLGYKQPTLSQKDNHPPLPLTITDPGYPVNSTMMGVVIIELTLDKNGNPTRVRTIQDVPSLTDVARDAIRAWKFMPAMESGQPVGGTLIVAISFLRPV